MKRLLLISASLLLVLTLSACSKDREPVSTETPVTNSPTEVFETEIPIETEEITITEQPATETEGPDTVSSTEIPLNFQKEGWISANEALTLLRMYLGSYSSEGYQYGFYHENTIYMNGEYYYNFRVSALITGDNGEGAHYSYWTNYLVSTDGIDIIEYVVE